MTELEKIQFLLNKGYKVDELGRVISPYGNIITKKSNYKKPDRAYIQICLWYNKKRTTIKAHRFAFFFYHGFLPDMLDHINGNPLDNTKLNLRPTTATKNAYNRKGVKGYHKTKSGKFAVNIYWEGNRRYCGTYLTEDEAHSIYLWWKNILHKF